jgi:hypothetical protein
LSPGSCAEFDADPYRFTRSPWIKSLIDSPLFNENVPTTSYDVVAISHPKKRSGRLFIKDMLRLEKILRFGSRGLYGTLGDNMTRSVYPEEFERLAAELRETCPDTPLKSGGSVSVVEVQQAAASVLDAARKVRR